MKKKVVPFLMVAALLSLVGCRKTSDERVSTVTYIDIQNFGGGVGSEWLTQAAARFQDIYKETSFEPGRKGVVISVQDSKSIDESQMGSSNFQIYFTESGRDPYELVSKGLLLDIDSVVKGCAFTEDKTIESKLDDGIKGAIQVDGKYFALPHYEWYPGCSYDIDLFEDKGFYFAAPGETLIYQHEYLGRTFNFVDDLGCKKSCGNDGEYGTEDDGLPTTLMEFLALCDYVTNICGQKSIIFPGNHVDYSNYLIQGILAGLVGKEGIEQFYNFSGEANVVTGFTNDDLFFEGSNIKVPTVEKQTIKEETGYKTRQTVERYYVLALTELLERSGFFALESKSASITNLDCQEKFVYGHKLSGRGNTDIAMLCEGNYWMNESHEIFDRYYNDNPSANERRIGWMSLPTSLDTPVTEHNGRPSTLMDTGYSYCLLNKKFEGTGSMDAAIEFIKFLYSDEELSNFTKATGVCKAGIDYAYDGELVTKDLNEHQKQVLSLKRANGVVYSGATNKTFTAHKKAFQFGIASQIWMPGSYKSIVDALRAPGQNAYTCFVGTQIDAATWASQYYVK